MIESSLKAFGGIISIRKPMAGRESCQQGENCKELIPVVFKRSRMRFISLLSTLCKYYMDMNLGVELTLKMFFFDRLARILYHDSKSTTDVLDYEVFVLCRWRKWHAT